MWLPLNFSQDLHQHRSAAGCFLPPWMDGWMCVHWKYMALILKWSSLQRAECILNWLLPPINATESPHGWFHPTLRLKGSFVFFTNNVSFSTDYTFLFCFPNNALMFVPKEQCLEDQPGSKWDDQSKEETPLFWIQHWRPPGFNWKSSLWGKFLWICL